MKREILVDERTVSPDGRIIRFINQELLFHRGDYSYTCYDLVYQRDPSITDRFPNCLYAHTITMQLIEHNLVTRYYEWVGGKKDTTEEWKKSPFYKQFESRPFDYTH